MSACRLHIAWAGAARRTQDRRCSMFNQCRQSAVPEGLTAASSWVAEYNVAFCSFRAVCDIPASTFLCSHLSGALQPQTDRHYEIGAGRWNEPAPRTCTVYLSTRGFSQLTKPGQLTSQSKSSDRIALFGCRPHAAKVATYYLQLSTHAHRFMHRWPLRA